ncbi:uncharacterized protein BDR25DRAFT_250173 [Lindgomyces ingoldianus]|uniref:Uncharacterized protein n=1 Tax=Lindgomyces ingoldianus TaxID=673940 RepID=A0ACB6REX3_9PLEO|nr:uncharacterized protein BDR25DRAFT_250173 [Lindgomyces ingoldianus]KAF2477858.1 hypothetical protein BDR25DRAFT_250173 [Lindgomyces ingoldianus]
MNETPGSVPRLASHPRRPPAHKSVSLRHSPPADRPHKGSRHLPQSTPQSSPNGPASDKANPPSTVSPIVTHKQSSGESSDAGKWFENTNNNAAQSNPSFVDNDPPFFLRNSSSSETPPDGQDPRTVPLHAQSMMMCHRPGLTHFGAEGSSTEDFRSVIDDLTIANKRLKQKLRKYERMYDAHLQNDKLFEVRFHGLPDHKKKELEESLRKFAADLDNSPPSEYQPTSYAPGLDHKTASSRTSRFAESGYASLSVSGQNSIPSAQDSGHKKMSKSSYTRQQQNVQSYLHDIPVGLLPKHPVPMTERSKKKLVVRRLEQIFAGKRQVPGNHPQPMLQEEVAQSAAIADRRAKEASGQIYKQEGLREARIMPAKAGSKDITGFQPTETPHKRRPSLAINEQDFADSGSPDQRPTRPLDLDPSRAQVPEENMEYIRHLGFTPPDMISGIAPEDDHGWIYLNLLTNMAQLHTINVTPDFVKEAVNDYSSKFELSHDGRKIRWRGGHDVTRNNDSSSDHFSGSSLYGNMTGSNSKSPAKLPKTSHSGSRDSMFGPKRQATRMARAAKEKGQGKLAYTPLFFHQDDSDDEDDLYNFDMLSSSYSPFQGEARGNSSGFASSAMRSLSSRRRREDGPIIFYNGAKFCTDLSSNQCGSMVVNPTSYKSITTQPIGAAPKPLTERHASGIGESGRPLKDASLQDMDLDSTEGGRTASSEEDFTLSTEALRNDSLDDSSEPMEFEASGIGGVQPDDNFEIKVKRSHFRSKDSNLVPFRQTTLKHRVYPHRILKALREQLSSNDEKRSLQPIIKEEIISAARKNLPNSTLPPASFLPFDSTSSGDVDSDLDSDVSSGPSLSSSSDEDDPATALPLLNISPIYNNKQYSSGSCNESQSDADDGGVDLLATARRLDPTAVIASEREYDAAFADRFAEEIPAGSSAATAGGGSGFISPASNSLAEEDRERGKKPADASRSASVSRTKNLKRSRTSDSLATALQPGKSQKLE